MFPLHLEAGSASRQYTLCGNAASHTKKDLPLGLMFKCYCLEILSLFFFFLTKSILFSFCIGPTNYGATFGWEMFGHSSSPSLFLPEDSENIFWNSTLPRQTGGQSDAPPCLCPLKWLPNVCSNPLSLKFNHITGTHLCPAFYIMGFETKYVPTSTCRCISENYASVIHLKTFVLEKKSLTSSHVFCIKLLSSLRPQISILWSSNPLPPEQAMRSLRKAK